MKKIDKCPLSLSRPFIYAEFLGAVDICGREYAVIQREHDGKCFYVRGDESPHHAVISELREVGFSV
jgi:hypothetical protein